MFWAHFDWLQPIFKRQSGCCCDRVSQRSQQVMAQLSTTHLDLIKTQGNYNNEIGLPYTVSLHMPEGTDKLIPEISKINLLGVTISCWVNTWEALQRRSRSQKENSRLRMDASGLLVVQLIQCYLLKNKVVRSCPDEIFTERRAATAGLLRANF